MLSCFLEEGRSRNRLDIEEIDVPTSLALCECDEAWTKISITAAMIVKVVDNRFLSLVFTSSAS